MNLFRVLFVLVVFACSSANAADRYTMGFGPYSGVCAGKTVYTDSAASVPAAVAAALAGCTGYPNAGWRGVFKAEGTIGRGEIYTGNSFAYSDDIQKIAGEPEVPPEDRCKGNKGKTGVTNWTMGYQRTPSINSKEPFIAPNNPTGKSACVDQCRVSLDVSSPCPGCRAYVSQHANAEGLYRVSTEFMSQQTGELCVPSLLDNPVKPSDSVDAKCPGYVGEVNGVKGCYGTADKPVTTQPNNVPSNFEQLPGNPAAGQLSGPPTPGSLATPTVGTGGSAGGPSGAATVGGSGSSAGAGGGSGSSVTSQGNGSGRVGSQSGTEQQNCGAPGQPTCDVKVNEDGLKDAKPAEVFDPANKEVETFEKKAEELRNKASGQNDKGFFENFRSLWITPPMAACEPFTLPESVGGRSLDPCNVVDGVRTAMGYIWALGGLILCFGMIKRTV